MQRFNDLNDETMVLLMNAVRGLVRGLWATQSARTFSGKTLNNIIHNSSP